MNYHVLTFVVSTVAIARATEPLLRQNCSVYTGLEENCTPGHRRMENGRSRIAYDGKIDKVHFIFLVVSSILIRIQSYHSQDI